MPSEPPAPTCTHPNGPQTCRESLCPHHPSERARCAPLLDPPTASPAWDRQMHPKEQPHALETPSPTVPKPTEAETGGQTGESDLKRVRFPDDVPGACHQRHPPKLVALDPHQPKLCSEPPAPTCKGPDGPQTCSTANCGKLQLCRSPLSQAPHQGDRRPKGTLTHTRGWPIGWAITRKKSGWGCGDLGKSAVVPKGTRK